MKIICLTSFVVLMSNTLVGQISSINVSLSQRTEKSFYHNEDYERLNYNYFFLGNERSFKGRKFSIELSYFQSKVRTDTRNVNATSDWYDSHSLAVLSSADVSFSYAGVRVSKIKELFPDRLFSLNLTGFLHLEVPVFKNESNHMHYSVETQSVWYPGSESHSSVTSEVSTASFNAITLQPIFATLGISILPRVNINRFYISPYASGGIAPKWRVHDNMSFRKLNRPNRHGGSEEFNSKTIKNLNLVGELGLCLGFRINYNG